VLDLVTQSFDLGIRIGHLSNSSMIAQQIGLVQRVVCASPTYWQTYGKPTKPSDLMKHRCVHFDGYAPHSEWEFDMKGKIVHTRPLVVMTTNHLGAALSACVAGVGCGVFLSYQVDAYLRDHSLVKVLSTYAKPALPINLVMPPGRMASARVKALKQWLAPQMQRRLLK
jgi:DNA-binding transcriptional LysR family regulator